MLDLLDRPRPVAAPAAPAPLAPLPDRLLRDSRFAALVVEEMRAAVRREEGDEAEEGSAEEEAERELWARIETGALHAARVLRPAPLRIGTYALVSEGEKTVDVRF